MVVQINFIADKGMILKWVLLKGSIAQGFEYQRNYGL